MIPRPRLAESFLDALTTGSRLRDDVLGDLAQEFDERAARDAAAARRWYAREVLRTVPHVLAEWGRQATWPELGRVAWVGIRAVVAFQVLYLLGVMFVAGAVNGSGSREALSDWLALHPGLVALGAAALLAAGQLLFGWLLFVFDRRTPIVSAFAWGLVTLVEDWGVRLAQGQHAPAWFAWALVVTLGLTPLGAWAHARSVARVRFPA